MVFPPAEGTRDEQVSEHSLTYAACCGTFLYKSHFVFFLSGSKSRKQMTYWLIINQLCWMVWMIEFAQSGLGLDLHPSSVPPFKHLSFWWGRKQTFLESVSALSCGALVPSTCWLCGVQQLRSTAQRCQNCCLLQWKNQAWCCHSPCACCWQGVLSQGRWYTSTNTLNSPEQLCLSRWVNSNKQKGESIQRK